MQAQPMAIDTARYARCINASKRILDVTQKFLPDGLSLVTELEFLTPDEQRFVSQIQGRSYANIFGLVERFINAKILEVSQDHWFGNQVALEALVRFSDEELKHQELFRRVERLAAEQMPPGYRFLPDPNDVAHAVLGKSTWAALQAEHRARRRALGPMEGRVSLSLEGGISARDHGRARVDP
jgi:hypothetical protein